MPRSIDDWDLSVLTPEEQALFTSALKKSEGEWTFAEKAAYNKAAQENIEGADTGGKAGFGTNVRDFQRQALMYSYTDPEEQMKLWSERTLGTGGFTDENGNWVAGEWEADLFYPADGTSSAISPPPGAKDKNGSPVPPG